MKKLLLVFVLALAALDASRAAGIQESNLPPVNTANLLDFLRITLKSTSGNSREITLSNFVSFLQTNGIANSLSVSNATNFLSRNLKSQDFPNLRRAVATNAPVMLIGLGDSLINGTQLYQPLFADFFTNYGFAGVIGQGGQGYLNPAVTTNATVQNGNVDSFKTWFSQYYGLPTGGCVIGTNANNAGGTMANVGIVQYQATNGAGTFIIETNYNNTGWQTCVASVNADNGGASTVRYAGFTNSFSSLLQIRARGLSRSNNIISLGLINLGTNGGMIYNEMSLPGFSLVDFNKVPTNHTWPVLQQWNPTCIAMEWLDNAAELVTNCPIFLTNFHRFMPQCDLLWVLPNPIQGALETDTIQQTDIVYTNCAAWGDHVFDGHGLFKDWLNGLTNGFLVAGLEPHPTTFGDKFEADAIFAWMNIFPSIKTYPGRRYLIAGQSIDTDGGSATVRGYPSDIAHGIFIMTSGTDPSTITNFGWYALDGSTHVWRHFGGGQNFIRAHNASGQIYIEPGDAFATFGGGTYIGAPVGIGTGPMMGMNASNVNILGPLKIGTNASVAGSVLKSFDTSGNALWAAPSNTYTLTLMSSAANTPADSTTYFVGGDFGGNDITSYNQARVIIPKAGTIKRCWVKINMTVASSAGEIAQFHFGSTTRQIQQSSLRIGMQTRVSLTTTRFRLLWPLAILSRLKWCIRLGQPTRPACESTRWFTSNKTLWAFGLSSLARI
jgi:hypothetical protein